MNLIRGILPPLRKGFDRNNASAHNTHAHHLKLHMSPNAYGIRWGVCIIYPIWVYPHTVLLGAVGPGVNHAWRDDV